jgi:hypothetical protein
VIDCINKIRASLVITVRLSLTFYRQMTVQESGLCRHLQEPLRISTVVFHGFSMAWRLSTVELRCKKETDEKFRCRTQWYTKWWFAKRLAVMVCQNEA